MVQTQCTVAYHRYDLNLSPTRPHKHFLFLDLQESIVCVNAASSLHTKTVLGQQSDFSSILSIEDYLHVLHGFVETFSFLFLFTLFIVYHVGVSVANIRFLLFDCYQSLKRLQRQYNVLSRVLKITRNNSKVNYDSSWPAGMLLSQK